MAEEWDVYSLVLLDSSGDPEYLATLYEASEKSIRVELDDTGTGSFAINRASPQCTEAILAQGNLVRVRIPEIDTDYIFAFFIETGDFDLISSDEAGGETLHFGGRGILSYLEYARAWSESYIVGGQDPIAGVWRAYAAGTGSAPGQILRREIEEFQDPDRPQQPLPHMTVDFDYDNDSTTDPWDTTDATDEFSYQVGEDGLAIVLRLLETKKIKVQMAPSFLLSAYNPANLGRDLTGDAFGAGVVRFERGVNIATDLHRQQEVTRVATHILVQGEGDKYGTAALGDASSRVTKEAFAQAFGTGTATLSAIGAVDLRERLYVAEMVAFPIANRRTADVVLSDPVSVGATLGEDALTGFYLPGPEGTNGDFWLNDRVRIHTGTGPYDYDELNARVLAITIARRDDNHELDIIPELSAPIAPTPCDDYEIALYEDGYVPPLGAPNGPTVNADGRTIYGRAGGGYGNANSPSPFYTGASPWHFGTYQIADAGAHNPAGWVDGYVAAASNAARLYAVGPGTMDIYTVPRSSTPTAQYGWKLQHLDGGGLVVTDSSGTEGGGGRNTQTVEIPNDGFCIHWVMIEDIGIGNTTYDGFFWTNAV